MCPANDEYDLISILGKHALFSNARLTDADVPKGLHVYHLRDNDYGDAFATIEPNVNVNHGGSVIMKEELDFEASDYIDTAIE